MKGELIQLYKIGRELGLAKKEINKIFSYNNFKGEALGGIMVIVIIIFIGFLIVLATFSAIPNSPNIPSNHTYQSGTLYSTVRIKDFNARK
jgi:divalent metal cation (Fe/Co/Zn/Cd) transporter